MFARAALRCRIPPAGQLPLARRATALRPCCVVHPRFLTSTCPRPTAEQPAATPTTELPPPSAPSVELPEFTPPPSCPGCGAPSQQVTATLPGYYSPTPSKRHRFGAANLKIKSKQQQLDDAIWTQALARLATEPHPPSTTILLAASSSSTAAAAASSAPPVCARCHTMVHHHTAPPLPSYPTLHTLTNLLLASQHPTNHIYHLIDAADLPLSLVPTLRSHLYTHLPRTITRGLTLSYVVTRADLLLCTETQVRSLATWIKKVLKDALPAGQKVEGREAEEGVHVVSASRGWGVGRIKMETRRREGGVWVVGAVNVGKSRLVREVWPEAGQARGGGEEDAGQFGILPEEEEEAAGDVDGAESAPARVKRDMQRKEERGFVVQVPPTVSHIPGTTAAPIRVKFKTTGGAGKKAFGELIDLPGFERWIGFGDNGLLPFVREDRRKEFRMEKMVEPEQYTIKPGQSMLIAGVILITPKITPPDAELVVLAYPFTSLPVHITSTKKALQLLSAPDNTRSNIPLYQNPPPPSLTPENTLPPTTTTTTTEPQPTLPAHFASAGTYTLADPVTHLRNPFLPNKDPAALATLPYRIVATDLLLAGLGWIELVAQVRQRHKDATEVEVEVFTPEGKGVGQRATMGADMLRKKGARLAGAGAAGRAAGRPRRSMKGEKKREKAQRREKEQGGGV